MRKCFIAGLIGMCMLSLGWFLLDGFLPKEGKIPITIGILTLNAVYSLQVTQPLTRLNNIIYEFKRSNKIGEIQATIEGQEKEKINNRLNVLRTGEKLLFDWEVVYLAHVFFTLGFFIYFFVV